MMEYLYRNIIKLNLANEKVDQTLVASPIIDFAGSFASIATLLIVMLGIGIYSFNFRIISRLGQLFFP